MRIDNALAVGAQLPPQQPPRPSPGARPFGEMLTQALEQVNDLQKHADALAVQASTGDIENVHEAVIAMEKAMLALELTVQVRNKLVEAYQELMRTQL
jgi:flagellar hook-basal body complex protein FliE